MQRKGFRHGILRHGFALLALGALSSTDAFAQPATPEIELNMSVLRDLQQPKKLLYPGATAVSPLRPPPEKTETAIVATVAEKQRSSGDNAVINRLLTIEPAAGAAHPLPKTLIPVIEGTITAETAESGSPPDIDRQQAETKPGRPTLISFPVQTRVRTDSLNPGLGTSSLLPPAKPVEPAPTANTAPPAPAAPVAPRPGRKPESPVRTAAAAKPPLPAYRPEKQNVPQAYADRMRQQTSTQPHPVKQDIAVRGIPKMPAVPAPAVRTETLPEADILPGDPLAQRLLEPDRFAMAKYIDQVQESRIDTAAGQNTGSNHVPLPSRKPAMPVSFTKGLEKHVIPFPQGKNQAESEFASALGEVLPRLKKNPALRLQIKGYAIPVSNDTGDARRISLARALSVRSWLLDQGIEARRIDVRALGIEPGNQPSDKVELVLFDPDAI